MLYTTYILKIKCFNIRPKGISTLLRKSVLVSLCSLFISQTFSLFPFSMPFSIPILKTSTKGAVYINTIISSLVDFESSDSLSSLFPRGNTASTLASNDRPLLPISHSVSGSNWPSSYSILSLTLNRKPVNNIKVILNCL